MHKVESAITAHAASDMVQPGPGVVAGIKKRRSVDALAVAHPEGFGSRAREVLLDARWTSVEGCPQAQCQFWNAWAWQSMVIPAPRLLTDFDGAETRRVSRRAELFHVILEKGAVFTVDRLELAKQIERVLPAGCQDLLRAR